MPTIDQIRAARALLNWSQSELADRVGMTQASIARLEGGSSKPNQSTLDKIEYAFENADIEFLGRDGLRKRKRDIQQLKGRDGLIGLMEDIRDTAESGFNEICLYNARPENWMKWVDKDWFYENYSKRMALAINKDDMRIIVEDGNENLVSRGHGTYRYFPKELFTDSNKSLYLYGQKIAFLEFLKDDIRVLIFDNAPFTESFRTLFDIAWNHVAKPISQQGEQE